MKSILFALFISLSISQFPLSSASHIQSHQQYVFLDFKITEVTPSGEIYGYSIDGKSEWFSMLESDLLKIPDAPTKLVVGDEIEIAWTVQDCNNENWDNIHSIEFLN